MINKKIMLKPQKKTSGSLHRLTIASSYTEFGYIEGEGGAIKPNSLRLSGFDQGSYSLLHGKSKHREVAFRGVQNYRPYKGSLSESVSIANKEALYA